MIFNESKRWLKLFVQAKTSSIFKSHDQLIHFCDNYSTHSINNSKELPLKFLFYQGKHRQEHSCVSVEDSRRNKMVTRRNNALLHGIYGYDYDIVTHTDAYACYN